MTSDDIHLYASDDGQVLGTALDDSTWTLVATNTQPGGVALYCENSSSDGVIQFGVGLSAGAVAVSGRYGPLANDVIDGSVKGNVYARYITGFQPTDGLAIAVIKR